MFRRRSTTLFIILVALPIALLVWLGTYLMRDASKRTEASMQGILAERLSIADYQLVDDMRQLTDSLDERSRDAGSGADAAQKVAMHPWVAQVWEADEEGITAEASGPLPFEPLEKIQHDQRAKAILNATQAEVVQMSSATGEENAASGNGGPPFQPVFGLGGDAISGLFPVQSNTSWQTFMKLPGYHLEEPIKAAGPKVPTLSGWHVSRMTFIYWQRMVDGRVLCALINTHLLMESLFPRLPHPGLEVPPGRMLLSNPGGILHQWGKRLEGSEGPSVAHRACSAPLGQWELSYTPANEEFPKPYLFPILLGMGSGVLLVLVVGWLYFSESSREITVAQQRVTFVNQISHELKTPLTNIRLYAEMASSRAEKQEDAPLIKQLSVISNESSRLDRLIQNVLSLARQQRDRLTISPKALILDDVIARTVDFWRPQLQKKGFEIVTDLHGPKEMMMADEDALVQVVGNLLSNVEKYGAPGHYVAVRTLVEGEKVKITVEDRGPGIPANKRKTIFEPFERLRSDLNEGVSGTGIGLTISRELAQLHGGSLSVCPYYREGSRFILTLPHQPHTPPS
ncbi:MAG: HAMP domain-containing histidine kinase [Verrucomicrobiaceae bacterium]|nr:HAMP domain-containing histidine kinase [Verrucomicrobiaceae bacterium]